MSSTTARAATPARSIPGPRRLPRSKLAIERLSLANGLRVVLSPDRSAPAVGIAVFYDVGFRSEPEGRTGFAHLFEHLMFQGTVNLAKGEADRLIEGNGGQSNASTHPDFTVYISQLPSNALELGLFIEADRMRGARLTTEALRNQIDVVKEEINVNVNNRPYGGFPWIDLPPIMFTTYNNAHNGYGSFVDLEAATLGDVEEFFDRFYAPGNAVLCVTGDFDVTKTISLIEAQFGPIRARPVSARPSWAEPVPTSERRSSKVDPLAPLPALAVAYRVPDPIEDVDDFLAAIILGDLLGGGEAGRLYQRMAKTDRLVTDVSAQVGAFGDPFEMRDPTTLQLLMWHPDTPVDKLLSVIDEEIASVVDGVGGDEVRRVVTSIVSGHLRQLDNVLQRAEVIGLLEQQRSRPELVNELPARLEAVTPAAISEVARRWLRPDSRAILELVAGATR